MAGPAVEGLKLQEDTYGNKYCIKYCSPKLQRAIKFKTNTLDCPGNELGTKKSSELPKPSYCAVTQTYATWQLCMMPLRTKILTVLLQVKPHVPVIPSCPLLPMKT